LWEVLSFRFFEVVPLLPFLLTSLQIFDKVLEFFADSHQLLKIFPALVGNPFVWFRSTDLIQGCVALEEEIELFLVEFLLLILDHDGHLETEHQLVLLEDTKAGILVYVEGEPIDDGSKTSLQH